jgi:cytochrome P450
MQSPSFDDLVERARLDDPRFYAGDPHPVYAELRRRAPVLWYEAGGFWAVSTYAEVTEVTGQPRLFSSAQGSFIRDIAHRDKRKVVGGGAGLTFGSDPPQHTQYRRHVSGAFTPRAASQTQPTVRRIVSDALDRVPTGEAIDFTEAVAVPVSINVIAELLGIPPSDWADFTRWSDALVDFIDVEPGSDEEARAVAELGQLRAYLVDQLERRRRQPTDDLMSVIAAIEIDGGLAPVEVQLGFAHSLLIAGNETTRNTLAAGAWNLARHPDQLRALVGDPALATSASDEILRWTSVIPCFVRCATAETTLRDQRIAAGDYVALLYAAANRDEAAWPDADVFDITRTGPTAHLAFAAGPHRCLGAHLARLEVRVALEELARRFRSWETAGPVVRSPSTATDRYVEVPLVFHAAN